MTAKDGGGGVNGMAIRDANRCEVALRGARSAWTARVPPCLKTNIVVLVIDEMAIEEESCRNRYKHVSAGV